METKEITVVVPEEVQIINAKANASFALTQAGQMAKQFATLQRMGQMYACSSIVPDTFKSAYSKYDKKTQEWQTIQNPSAIGNCAIAVDMAQRMNVNPLMIMQNLFVVGGNPSFSSKFLISCINASGRFTPLRYEFKGEEGKDDYGCRCYAYEKGDTERKDPLYGDWITWKVVKGEGWDVRQGSKWKSMPNQMFRYRAAAFWQRVYCPEISMGFITSEEYEDADIVGDNGTPSAAPSAKKTLLDVATEAAMQQKAKAVEVVDTETGEIKTN